MAAIKALSLFLLFLLFSSSVRLSAPNSDLKDNEQRPLPVFTWSNNSSKFIAGDLATIEIKPLNNEKLNITSFKPILTVNRKSGNSCYLSGILSDFKENSPWKIVFTPIRSGLFDLLISDEKATTQSTILHFDVTPGLVYPSVCSVSWRGLVNEFSAGSKAAVSILPKDAFGNNVTTAAEPVESYNFTVSILHGNGSCVAVPSIVYMGRNELGFIVIEFVLTMAGNFSLQVLGQGSNLDGSPLPFIVNPGPLDISKCEAKPKFETTAWQIYSKVEVYVHQHDPYGNLVQGLYVFDADVIEVETNLSIPISDMYFEEVAPGIQLLSFHAVEWGNFSLDIFGESDRRSISKMPLRYAVFAGFCNGSTSIVNGSGLNMSRAGEFTEFTVYLNDDLQYPSAVEVERLQVEVVRKIDSSTVRPTISPLQVLGDNSSSKIWGSSFQVNYTPEKSGLYEINVRCGNVVLNDGRPLQKQVIAGEVNISLSSIVKFDSKVPQQIENEVVVQLLDSHSNPVLSQRSRLKLEVVSLNDSSLTTSMFWDNNDGSYTSHYMVNNTGNYELCTLFDDQRLSSCPCSVDVYNGGYFPTATNDIITVLEDESIGFDALANDFFASSNAEIVAYTQPDYGSVLQRGPILRYTPYRDFHGTDFFTYTMSDAKNNHDTSSVTVHILKKPPEFLDFPYQLHAIENVISPESGGYSGLSITSSDPDENITVNLGARYGKVSLFPMVMSFRLPELSINEENEDLVLRGRVEVVNSALHSFQYLGKENFSGEDTIRVSTKNANGKNVLDISVFVKPVNNPPFISVPKFIILCFDDDKSLIFDKTRDKFNFFVGDPDLQYFPGGDGNFVVAFSVEVNDGFLVTALPSELINTTELKLRNVYRWQPLQSYVTISKHFVVKAVGIRFQGTIKNCNSVLQELYYQVYENLGLKKQTGMRLTWNKQDGVSCREETMVRF